MKWLTDKSRLEQANEPNDWYLADNELFKDEDSSIYLVPRKYKTDNYTVPDWVAWIAGSKSKWDVRPAHIHDFGCQFHQLIKVTLNEQQLKQMRFLRVHNDKIVCENIPIKYLEIIPVSKWQIDCLFKRAMKATGDIPNSVLNLFRCGVFFNIGWVLGNHSPFDLSKIYTMEQNNNGKS